MYRIRKAVENYPKYSWAYSGARAIFEQFPRAGYRRKKKGGELQVERGERRVILAGLPVISRFYSGRLARRGSFSWKMSSSSRTRPYIRPSSGCTHENRETVHPDSYGT